MPLLVRLDRLLLERRMSLAELADRTGLSAANLAILRNGEAQALRVATLEALCQALRCQPGDLLGYEEDEPSSPAGEGVGEADG
jgi:putative transcriptional regulator